MAGLTYALMPWAAHRRLLAGHLEELPPGRPEEPGPGQDQSCAGHPAAREAALVDIALDPQSAWVRVIRRARPRRRRPLGRLWPTLWELPGSRCGAGRHGEYGEAADDQADAGPLQQGRRSPTTRTARTAATAGSSSERVVTVLAGTGARPQPNQDAAGEHGDQSHVSADGRVGPGGQERGTGGQQHRHQQQPGDPEDGHHRRAGGDIAADPAPSRPARAGAPSRRNDRCSAMAAVGLPHHQGSILVVRGSEALPRPHNSAAARGRCRPSEASAGRVRSGWQGVTCSAVKTAWKSAPSFGPPPDERVRFAVGSARSGWLPVACSSAFGKVAW